MTTRVSPLAPRNPFARTKSGEDVFYSEQGFRDAQATREEIDVNGGIVGAEEAQTLKNKSIDADENIISNLRHGDEVDNPTSGVHGVAGNVVGTTDPQTLLQKTLTAPVINSPTGIVKADVGLGNVDNTSDATKNSAVATLTNKTFGNPPIFPEHTVAGVPSAATFDNGVIIVSDETGGRTLATSDGANWLRVSDGAVIS